MGVRLFRRGRGLAFSPLTSDNVKKRVIQNIQEKYTDTSNSQHGFHASFSLYVGESFTVKIPYSTNITNLVHNAGVCGLITTDFLATRDMKSFNLTAGGHKMLSVPNAGGSSVVSEVLSFELLGRCFGAKLTKTEMEISYFPRGGSMTDYVCEVSEVTVGVSVTRAWKYQGDYSLEDATALLNKKLKGVIQSNRNTMIKWNKQILHVWSSSDLVTDILHQAYSDLDPEVKANTIVLVSTASSADYIFKNG